MSDLPAPMVPPGCDLRGFMEWSRFFGERVFKSHWYQAALNDPRGGIAALKLWWTAMLECPAGSLPNDEKWLCRMADFGQDIRSWRKHRTTAMHGFVLCADGRWYHPFLADEARAAWERRLKSDRNRDQTAERTRQWRQRSNGGGDASHHASPYASRDAPVTGDVTSRAGEEIRKTREEKKEPTPTPSTGRGGTPAAPGTPPAGRRLNGTNPRVEGTNPRNLGTNPRATGTNPRAAERREGFVSGGIAVLADRLRQRAEAHHDDDLTDESSYFPGLQIVEGGRG